MQPTFNPDLYKNPLHHDVVLLDKWSVALGRFRRGDVVTLWSPQNPELLTTKRVVALEGDVVSTPGGLLWRRGCCGREAVVEERFGGEVVVKERCLTPGIPVTAITAHAGEGAAWALLGRGRLALSYAG